MLPPHLHLQRTSTHRPHPQLPHSHDLADFKALDRQLDKKIHSKLPSPRNLPLVVWTKGNLSAHHYNTPRARPATISVQHPPSRNGTPNAVNSAFSLMRAAFVDEPRLEITARDKRPPRHTPVTPQRRNAPMHPRLSTIACCS